MTNHYPQFVSQHELGRVGLCRVGRREAHPSTGNGRQAVKKREELEAAELARSSLRVEGQVGAFVGKLGVAAMHQLVKARAMFQGL